MTWDQARVSLHVKSQTRIFPWLQGKRDMPSGRSLSVGDSPKGSNATGTSAEAIAFPIRSFACLCRECRPAALLQLRPCLPEESTRLPHGHLWGWQIGKPSLRPQQILKLVLSSFKPRLGIGMALSHADACSEFTASSLAFSSGESCLSSSWVNWWL